MERLVLNIQLRRGTFDLELQETGDLTGVLGILGPSGSGKTTLLRALAGLEKDVRGEIRFGDHLWLDSDGSYCLPPHRRRIGYVFQEALLFPHLDVAGNLNFAQRRGVDRRIEVDRLVSILELSHLLGRRPESLSGGERQRVALARALVGSPRLLLLDEPLAAIDAEHKTELLPFLRRVVEEFSVPALYVSHSLDELSTLSDRLLVLRGGRTVARGPTAEVMGQLNLREVSGRVEAGTVAVVRVLNHDADYHLTTVTCCGQTLSIPGLVGSLGGTVRLHIHARDVALATEEPSGLSIRNVLRGRVLAVAREAQGPHAEVLVAVGDTTTLRARITRASLDELGIVEGRDILALVKAVSVEAD